MATTKEVATGILLSALASVAAARADDGGISFGGSPHLLSGHDSVSMKSELVTMNIGKDSIKVDCGFIFHNGGKACLVRMGFPDEGQGAMIPYEGQPLPKWKLKATFTSYDSWVDGKKVPTKLVPTNDRTLFWHTKTVHFPANSDCAIRDLYRLPPGAQVTAENGMYQQTSYVLHTGSSWKGSIGRAEVVVNFAPDVVRGPLNVRRAKSLTNLRPAEYDWSKLPANTVLYDGPNDPKVSGNTLRFVCNNLKPTEQDDIHLYYAWRKLTNMP